MNTATLERPSQPSTLAATVPSGAVKVTPSWQTIFTQLRNGYKVDLLTKTPTLNVRFFHARVYTALGDLVNYGGMTFAYRELGRNMMEIAVSHCNPKDAYDKVLGRHYAASNWENGKRIQVPKPALGENAAHNIRLIAEFFNPETINAYWDSAL